MTETIALGPTGQLLLLVISLALALLTWRQRHWQSTAKAAQMAVKVITTELEVYRERADRLSKENRELVSDNAGLRTRTDLTPIVDAINSWTNESRGHFLKAMERLEVIHGEQTEAMKTVCVNLAGLNERLTRLNCNQRD